MGTGDGGHEAGDGGSTRITNDESSDDISAFGLSSPLDISPSSGRIRGFSEIGILNISWGGILLCPTTTPSSRLASVMTEGDSSDGATKFSGDLRQGTHGAGDARFGGGGAGRGGRSW